VLFRSATNLFLAAVLLPVMLSRKGAGEAPKRLKALLPIGMASAFGLIFQMTAISMALVAYVISIKRTSAVISVLFGRLFFNEKSTRERLAGAMVMVLGVALITVAG
jgi:uncharacterized membrane protein